MPVGVLSLGGVAINVAVATVPTTPGERSLEVYGHKIYILIHNHFKKKYRETSLIPWHSIMGPALIHKTSVCVKQCYILFNAQQTGNDLEPL